jgi:hypothetical protein
MKVALISHEGGGTSSITSGLAQGLAKNGIDTTMFTGTYSKIKQTKLSSNLEIIRLPILNLPPRPYWFQVLNFNTLSKTLADYDVVHGVSPIASFLLTLFKHKFSKPFVTTLHEDP